MHDTDREYATTDVAAEWCCLSFLPSGLTKPDKNDIFLKQTYRFILSAVKDDTTMKSTGRVTLSDIAQKTGFTINTVSRALKNKTDISQATREMIQQAAKEMGYVRNALASSLRSGHTKTIAVILGEMSNPYYALMADEIQKAASRYDYTLIILCSRDNPILELKAAQTAVSHQADGVLLFPCYDYRKTEEFLYESGMPCVLMSRHSADESCFDTVVCDEAKGAYLATTHLFENGCSKIAMLSKTHVPFASEKRTEGFLSACKANGMAEAEKHVFLLPERDLVAQQVIEWQKNKTTGIFCFCDNEAWRLISVLHEMGLNAFSGFAMVGFDNIQNNYAYPFPLCSIGFDVSQMTSDAVSLLIRRIHHDSLERQSLIYPVSLTCRKSCKKFIAK